MKRVLILVFISLQVLVCYAGDEYDPSRWEENRASEKSLAIRPLQKKTRSLDGLELYFKRFPRTNAQPILLIHGLAQNDRIWDSPVKKYSFARFLHANGFDVWIGNMRSAGTEGFRSETPLGPHHWTVDDFAINDIPALIQTVREQTGQAPWIIGHSLAAWGMNGYLAGLSYDADGKPKPNLELGDQRQKLIRGVIMIAGVYNLWWEKSVANATVDPIRTEEDFYHSNYELELITKVRAFYSIIPYLPALPLNWIGSILSIPFSKIPWIGGRLQKLYEGFADTLVSTPILSMFYFWPNNDPEVVRLHGVDGLEDLGPHVLEQLANMVNHHEATTYYHLERPQDAFDYRTTLKRLKLPLLFVGGGRDRLASAPMIYRDGFQEAGSADKEYLHVDRFGHLDIINGINAAKEVMGPVAKWIHQHGG